MVKDETMRNTVIPLTATALFGYVGYQIGREVPIVPAAIAGGLGYYLTKPD